MIRLVNYKYLKSSATYMQRVCPTMYADNAAYQAGISWLKQASVGAKYNMCDQSTGKVRAIITKLGADMYSIAA